MLPCLSSSQQYAIFKGDPGDEGDIGEPGPSGLTVRQPDKPRLDHVSIRPHFSFSLYFQGQNGNPGKSGPSGDPVRLLKAISIFRMSGNMCEL